MLDRLLDVLRPAPPARPLGALGVDMHAHWLPGLDDGARNLDESLDLIDALAGAGFRTLVATPHVMSDAWRNGPDTILPALERVREAVRDRHPDLRLEAAAEYYLDKGLWDAVESGCAMPFGGNYILFEPSMLNRPRDLPAAIFRLRAADFKPVLAHVERYPYYQRPDGMAVLEGLRERGLRFQLNLGSLVGAYGPGARRLAHRLVDAGWIDFAGTDIHRASQAAAFPGLTTDRGFHRLLEAGSLRNHALSIS